MKKILLIIFLMLIPIKVYADDASDISKESTFSINDVIYKKFTDDSVKTVNKIPAGNNLVIYNPNGNIKQLYIIYEISSKKGTLTTSNNEIKDLGSNDFLHEYINLDKAAESVTLNYNEDTQISEIRVFTEGNTPKDVQKWTRESYADLMIFSTHADDEQLFFAGVMPTYINRGKKVHVVYLARHDVGSYYAPSRLHEQLDGLWALGVTDYPTFGLIPDAYSENIDAARSQMNAAGFTDDDVIKFDVDQLRKYKPKVVLGHDENGEYGHGQHRLNCYTLKQAIEKSGDTNYTDSSLEVYSVPKFYIHLYDMDNKTVLNYDEPLEKYDGKTAYEISKEGYSKHLSQQYTWFTDWLRGKNSSYTSATQITKYNPAYWGLYKTDVGPDVNKNDLFENIVEEKEEVKEEKVIANTKETNKESKKKQSIIFSSKYRKYAYIGLGVIIFILLIEIKVFLGRKKTRK